MAAATRLLDDDERHVRGEPCKWVDPADRACKRIELGAFTTQRKLSHAIPTDKGNGGNYFHLIPSVRFLFADPEKRIGVIFFPMQTRYTPSGVRLQLHSTREGPLNWLLLPGGPGLGSESLLELAVALDVPGSIWLVDLPGDGSNTVAHSPDPFANWPDVLIEAVDTLPEAIFVGHSTGGMYLLATPALQGRLRGLALLDSAPNSAWHADYVAMTRRHPLPEFDLAVAAYSRQPTLEKFTAMVVAATAWNFTPSALTAGRKLLARLPYNIAAVTWSDTHFDHAYQARWWPSDIPVLRLYGDSDRIVSQHGWRDPAYHTPNHIACEIAGAGHFPWIENPEAVTQAFRDFAAEIQLHSR